jgi:N-methylhydantoinase B
VIWQRSAARSSPGRTTPILGGSEPGGTLALARYEGPSAEAGPQIIADPADYVDAAIVFRQYCCPSCWTALYSAVVPAGHTDTVTSIGRLTVAPSALSHPGS